MVRRGFSYALLILVVALVAMLLTPLYAQTGLRGLVTYANATNTTVPAYKWGGSVYLVNATSNAHVLTVGNASSLKPGDRLRIYETKGSAGNWTISSVSNINGAANFSVTAAWQMIELEAIAPGFNSTTATAFTAHTMSKTIYAP